MNKRWVMLLLGFGLLTLPTVLTNSASISSFEALPLLGAVAIGTWLRNYFNGRSQRATNVLWSLLIGATLLATALTLLPITRSLMVGLAPHENTLAAFVGCLALLSSYRLRTRWYRFLILGAAILTSLELESRSVTIALMIVTLLYAFKALTATRTHSSRYVVPPAFVLCAVVIGLGAAVLVVPNWRAQARGVIALFSAGTQDFVSTSNLVPASEMIGEWPWSLDGVTVSSSGVDQNGYAVFTVTKLVGSATARPQFRLVLDAGASYSLSLALKAEGDSLPGLTGWAPSTDALGEVVLRAYFRPSAAAEAKDDTEEVVVNSSNSTDLSVAADATSISTDGWVTLVVHLTNNASIARSVWLGPTPDIRPDTVGAVAFVSRFAAREGILEAVPYVATERLSPAAVTARSRIQTFSLALEGIRTAPLVGHGFASFRQQQLASNADGFSFAHAHNLALHVAFERGLVGLLGLSLLVAGLLRFPLGKWQIWNILVAGILLMNMTDMTFWSAAVTLPLGLALGSAPSRIELPPRTGVADGEPLV